jgi:hypothetical protein
VIGHFYARREYHRASSKPGVDWARSPTRARIPPWGPRRRCASPWLPSSCCSRSSRRLERRRRAAAHPRGWRSVGRRAAERRLRRSRKRRPRGSSAGCSLPTRAASASRSTPRFEHPSAATPPALFPHHWLTSLCVPVLLAVLAPGRRLRSIKLLQDKQRRWRLGQRWSGDSVCSSFSLVLAMMPWTLAA